MAGGGLQTIDEVRRMRPARNSGDVVSHSGYSQLGRQQKQTGMSPWPTPVAKAIALRDRLLKLGRLKREASTSNGSAVNRSDT